MLKIYQTIGDELHEVESIAGKGLWIELINPTESEIRQVAEATNLLPEFLKAALDEEERPRIETDEGQVLIVINIPFSRGDNGEYNYDTMPLGIVINDNVVVTVCLRDNPLSAELHSLRVARSIHTQKKTRFLLQILFYNAALFLKYLRLIDRKSNEIERVLHGSTKNEELIRLLNLGKSLTYFTTSLRSNEIVLEKLLKSKLVKVGDEDAQVTSRILKMYEEDEDLLEDVITENKQAIEMAEVYSSILAGTMDAFATIISNNQNTVMKFLASVTIIMALPTMVASFYGMNVALPFQRSPFAFLGTLVFSGLLVAGATYMMRKRKMM
ncbi:MAG: magnesium transporter CorA family protein [Firmicutes bacterium]|nr:magnesium transporter CorA family protein [Bacillota bacterium]